MTDFGRKQTSKLQEICSSNVIKGELFSGKFEPDRIAKSFNSIFEKGKLETDYGNREDLANKIYEEYF